MLWMPSLGHHRAEGFFDVALVISLALSFDHVCVLITPYKYIKSLIYSGYVPSATTPAISTDVKIKG